VAHATTLAQTDSVKQQAWLLNFEASTAEFENSCIKPSYELMRLCSGSTQQSPKQFMFVSSITSSIHAVGPSGLVEEKPVDDQRGASGMGYGQSKLVTERLATQYAARFNVPVTIARVGQIAGDTVNGRSASCPTGGRMILIEHLVSPKIVQAPGIPANT
jgi:thioester reductase-like protein